MPTVSLIIPQYGKSEFTQTCVRSFVDWHGLATLSGFTIDLIVVDDGSTPQDRRLLQTLKADRLRVLPCSRNLGITYAWNFGLKHSQSEYVVLLNNDVTSTGNWLKRLVAPLGQNQQSLCGAALRREGDLPIQIVNLRGNRFLLEGWCLAFHRPTALKVGMFDDQMRLYFSDTDWQCRWIERFGSESLRCMKDLPLKHTGHATANSLRTKKAIWNRDRHYFLTKWRTQDANASNL